MEERQSNRYKFIMNPSEIFLNPLKSKYRRSDSDPTLFHSQIQGYNGIKKYPQENTDTKYSDMIDRCCMRVASLLLSPFHISYSMVI